MVESLDEMVAFLLAMEGKMCDVSLNVWASKDMKVAS